MNRGAGPPDPANDQSTWARWRPVDEVDAALLRELWKGGSLGMARHDPRIRISALARGIGLDRTSVRDRLRRWREVGFLTRFQAVPNPSLFGYTVTGSGVRIDDNRRKEDARAALAKVEESFAWMDHVGPWIGVASICSSPMHARTLQERYAALPGVDEATPLFDSAWPKAEVAVTPLDWRLIHAMRHDTEATLQEIGKRLKVSTSTVTRRYDRLVNGGAVVVVPVLDFTYYTGAALVRLLIHLGDGVDPGPIAAAIRKRPETIVAYPLAPEGASPFVDVYVHVESAGMAGAVEKDALDLEGVEDVEILWPRDHCVFPDSLDAHLERALAASRASGSS